MRKKRITIWIFALFVLVLTGVYYAYTTTLKIQEAEAGCIRYLIVGCKSNGSSCCSSGYSKISHIWVGKGVYDRYATLCYKN
jgi:hypothetical protein